MPLLRFSWILAFATVGALGCGSHCDLAGSVACLCGDGTCQAGAAGCGGTSTPTCDELCQSHRGPAPDAGSMLVCPRDAGVSLGGVLQGPNGFTIGGEWMSPHETTAACRLTSTVLADGGIAAVGIQLFASVSSAALCASNSGQDAGIHTGLALNIGIGTPQYVAASQGEDAGPLTEVLTPGVYTLFNQDVSDQTLCAPIPGYDAVLTEFELDAGNAIPLFNGVGTITIDQFGNGTLFATLNVWLVSVDGTPGVDGGPLTGSFGIAFCP